MKNKIPSFIFFFLVLFFSSCSNENNTNKEKGFEFFIYGKVTNGAGEKLQLNIPSLYPNNILETTIENGHYSFKGKLQSYDKGELSISEKMEGFFPLRVYITEDTLQLDLDIGQKFGETTFVADTIVKSVLNRYAKKFDADYWKANGTNFYRDSLRNDSMRKYIYPEVRKKSFSVYENGIVKKEHAIIGLNYLREILENNVVYDKKDLTKAEKQKLRTYFQNIDSALKHTADYKIVRSYIDKLDVTNTNQEFIEYTLIDIHGEEKKLSKIVSKNKFTVLEFWHSVCIPCRKFNQEGRPDYQKLKAAGIEIISINTDRKTTDWKNASKKDSIMWTNVYAGANSSIIPDYEIRSYPTSYIFDENQQLIKFKFKSASDLLKLIEQK